MTLLAIDIGTTHCKAGLFAEDGTALQVRSAATPIEHRADTARYESEQLWRVVRGLIDSVSAAAGRPRIAAVGVASMAETGLLLDRRSGTPRTPFLPWFDTAAAPFADQLARHGNPRAQFSTFGLHPSFKCSLAKILWARAQSPALLHDAVWLSAADYIAYRLTGTYVTDYTLAGRTYAFQLRERCWDTAWLRQLDLPDGLLPPVLPSGTPVGTVAERALAQIGLTHGTPVAVAGHDHVCGAVGAGAARRGRALDSMGTAEALIGALDHRALDEAAFRSGLTFGVMPLTDTLYWLGGLSASGGSLDWLRRVLGDPPLGYNELQALQERMSPEPGTLLFLPYLAGSGAPHTNAAARGAFIGLAAGHTRADLLKAVLEGTAYQMEAVRRAAAAVIGQPIGAITAAGGGTRNRRWMQIKADVYGIPLRVLAADEATLLGAALIAGVGCGVYRDATEALSIAERQHASDVAPNMARHKLYTTFFEGEFHEWQERITAQSA